MGAMTERLRIGAFSRKTGLSRDTIRFYERRGLLKPFVEPNGYRTFDQAAIERALAIQVAQGLGFSLNEVAKTIGAWEKRGLTRSARLSFIDEKIAELELRIGHLSSMKRYLEKKAEWIRDGEDGVPPEMLSSLTGPRRARLTPRRGSRPLSG
jgi:DNA-binding transcriptional MerR regulator